MTTRVAVTGAAGYIGGQTCIELKALGYHVTAVDLRPLPNHLVPFVDKFYQQNIAQAGALLCDVDGIVHCAGTSLVGPSIKDPAIYYANNVGASAQMISDLAKNQWSGRLVFSSSAAIYGDPKKMPIKERTVAKPINPYGHSKLFCENLLADSVLAYKFSAISLRYFNACSADLLGRHGQEDNATHIFAKIFDAVRNNQHLKIYGNNYPTRDGTCVRDYVHVVDIAHAHIQALKLPTTMPYCVYNLGTRQGFSVLEIVHAVEQNLGHSISIEFVEPRTGDPAELVADSSLFQTCFDWQPTNSNLPKILESLRLWYKV